MTDDIRTSSAKVVDARGSYCPRPLMELTAAMNTAEVGDELEVLSSDKGSGSFGEYGVKEGVWHVLVHASITGQRS